VLTDKDEAGNRQTHWQDPWLFAQNRNHFRQIPRSAPAEDAAVAAYPLG